MKGLSDIMECNKINEKESSIERMKCNAEELNKYEKSDEANSEQKNRIGWVKKSLIISCLIIATISTCFLYYLGTTARIPDIKNKNINEVAHILADSNIQFAIRKEYSNTIAEDVVIKLSQEEGRIKKKSGLIVTVSKGVDNRILVPDVVGMIAYEAEELLKTVDVKTRYNYSYGDINEKQIKAKILIPNDNTTTMSYLYEQNDIVTNCINSGKKVEPGSEVEIYVSKPAVYIEYLSFDIGNRYNPKSLSMRVANVSDKEIKYMTFQIQQFNSVGDPSYDADLNSTKKLKYTGPLEPGYSDGMSWDYVRNGDTACVAISSIEIEFMDGTKQILSDGSYAYDKFYYYGEAPDIRY